MCVKKIMLDLQVLSFFIDVVIKLVHVESYLGFYISTDFTDEEAFCKERKGMYMLEETWSIESLKRTIMRPRLVFKSFCTNCLLNGMLLNQSFNLFTRHLQRYFQSVCSKQFVLHNVSNFTAIRRKVILSLNSRGISSENISIKAIVYLFILPCPTNGTGFCCNCEIALLMLNTVWCFI